MKMKAYRSTASTIKKIAQKRAAKIDIYDDRMLDALDDMASKWAARVEQLGKNRKLRV